MVCGVARFSARSASRPPFHLIDFHCPANQILVRSIVATATFFATGVITAHIAHTDLAPTAPLDWSLGGSTFELIYAQSIPLAVSILLYLFVSPL